MTDTEKRIGESIAEKLNEGKLTEEQKQLLCAYAAGMLAQAQIDSALSAKK